MKSANPISVGSPFLILSITAFALFLPGPAQCQPPEIALLLQQTPSQGGIVSPQIGVHHFVLDAEVTIIAIPKPGYQFLYWLGDVLDKTANKTTTRLDKPKIIVAVFQQLDQDQLVVGQNRATTGGGGGSVFTSGRPITNSAPSRRGGGGDPPGNPPTEGDDPVPPDDPPIPPDDPPIPPDDPPIPPDDPPIPPEDPPIPPEDPPIPPEDPPIPPEDPPIPPEVPEPATGILLTLGGLALLKKRRAQ